MYIVVTYDILNLKNKDKYDRLIDTRTRDCC